MSSVRPRAASRVLDENERAVLEVAEEFARAELSPRYQAREKTEQVFDRELLRAMGGLGLIAPDAPEAFGGLGLPCSTSGLIAEAIGYGDFNVAYVPVLGSLVSQIIAAHAEPDVARQWVPRIVAGDALVALALTEPRGGSDAANLVVQATRCDGGYRLRGEKNSISMADQADAFVVFARTGPAESGARGVSAFLVRAATEGVTATRFEDLGSRIVGRGSIFFDDLFVPSDHRLGDEGGGFRQVMQGFDFSRALLGLQCVGAAQASLDETWRYVTERRAFGEPISAFQGVTFPLAEGETAIAAARELCHHTLRLRDAGLPHSAEAAMCKWLGPKTAVDVIHQCLLTHGHYGWSLDLPHQQRLRDVMGIEIGDGTAQIMKMIIARSRLAAAEAT
jgi:cyclohexanecarboxyl-CoA dehydrogenase